MAHSDDDGLIIPPKLAPIHVVVVPIFKNDEELSKITAKVDVLVKELRQLGLSVKFDNRDTHKPGFKFAEYEMRGVPVRIAIGPRDVEAGTVELARRDTKEKKTMPMESVAGGMTALLDDIQQNIYNRALKFRQEMTTSVDSYDEMKRVLDEEGWFHIGALGTELQRQKLLSKKKQKQPFVVYRSTRLPKMESACIRVSLRINVLYSRGLIDFIN